MQAQFQVGVHLPEAPDDARQHPIQRGADKADRHLVLDLADALGHRLQLGGLGQQLQRVGVEVAPGVGQLERARVALEQLHAQVILQLLDLARQRGLGDMQPLGRAGEVAFLCHGHEVTQVPQFHDYTSQVSGRY
ncbi:hypothetical protein D9M68_839620 [compost metagenome]